MSGSPEVNLSNELFAQVKIYFEWCEVLKRSSSLAISGDFLDSLAILQADLLAKGAISDKDRIFVSPAESPLRRRRNARRN